LLLLSIRLAAERPHAVLPHVSMGYSPPKGRSPTCYSPVRHSHVEPKPHIPVRLACLIRAASVRSEPGSNSPSYSVASHSEEQKAQFSYSVLYNSSFTRFKLTSLDPYLFSSLPFPIAEKHPHRFSLPHRRLSHANPEPSTMLRAFLAFQRSVSIRPSDPPLGLRRKSEFTPLKQPMSSTNAKINLSLYGILKRPLVRGNSAAKYLATLIITILTISEEKINSLRPKIQP
jgi:hypothetical protein